MPERREPNERERPERLTPADWEVATAWRPLAYRAIRDFVAHRLKRSVRFQGKIGTTNFRWVVDGGSAYGVDPVGICQDLEYRALEALAVASRDFRERGEEAHLSEKFLRKAVLRKLQNEFDRWVVTSSSPTTINYGSTVTPLFSDEEEPSYVEEFDRDDAGDGLSDEDRAKLQSALGVLSSKEAWALRMLADGLPMDVIAERLGYIGEKSVFKLIKNAREKGQRAYEETQDG